MTVLFRLAQGLSVKGLLVQGLPAQGLRDVAARSADNTR
jgi:hypothetical protein